MRFVEIIKKDSNRLFATSLILISGALLIRVFPFLSFIALAPLFALLDCPNNFRNSFRLVVASLLIGGIVYFITQKNIVLNIVLYATWVVLLFWTFAEVQRARPNILNKFALVIFMLGAEYIIVKFVPLHHEIFLADLLGQKPEWIRWNIYIGYLASSLWILSANLIFYQGLFKFDKVKKRFLVMGILFVTLPIIYSHYLSNQAISKMDMVSAYANEGVENSYSANGELISRTGAWVSVLIVIFTIVKSKTKRSSK